MTFVLDANTCLSWLLPDERPSEAANEARLQLRRAPALVPAIWSLEVVNTLLMAERRGRLERPLADRIFLRLLQLPVHVAAETCELSSEPEAWPLRVHRLARDHSLTSYDASYVLLAQLRGIPLASDDSAMNRVARELSIPVFGHP